MLLLWPITCPMCICFVLKWQNLKEVPQFTWGHDGRKKWRTSDSPFSYMIKDSWMRGGGGEGGLQLPPALFGRSETLMWGGLEMLRR